MKRVCVGIVVGAHGLRGLLRCRSFTEPPENLIAYGSLSDETGSRHWRAIIKSRDKQTVFVQFTGVDTREAALALKGVRLFVDRQCLPPPESDSYYHTDLIGLRVVDGKGKQIGHIQAVQNFGAGDILELLLTNGRTADLPFTRQVVLTIDLAQGVMTVNPPPGLWDDG